MKKLKYLLSIFIFSFVWICFWNIVNASDWYFVRQIWNYWYNPFIESQDIAVIKNWTPLTQLLWYTKRMIWLNTDFAFFWNDWNPALLRNYTSWSYPNTQQHYFAWKFLSFMVCDELDWSDISSLSGCSTYIYDNNTKNLIYSFLSTVSNDDYFVIYRRNSWNQSMYRNAWFWISSSKLWQTLYFYYTSQYNADLPYLDNSIIPDTVWTYLDFSSFPEDLLWFPPTQWSIWGWWWFTPDWWITIWSNESAINYFENRYGWNENICYVWVDNMTDLWWSSVSFQEWTWLTIFEAFEKLYWNTDLDKVYVWINSRLINYWQWFWRNWDPLYLASYNSWTNQVDLRYENLTFPFINNPVAVYFMSDYMTRNSEYDTMWSEIVSYCNLKINDWTFDEIIDQSTKNNINKYTEQSNINKWLNFDWSPKVFTWPFVSLWWTGFDNDHWGDKEWTTDLKWFFDHAMDEMQSVWQNWVQNPFTWILPNRLIYSFIVIVLFKLLRK